MGENYIEATAREVREEVGIDIQLLRPNRPDFVQDIVKPDEYHFIILTSAVVPVSPTVH
jgi:8-oxo-dGTP pyrophosphatase MutT (NUDIX family)